MRINNHNQIKTILNKIKLGELNINGAFKKKYAHPLNSSFFKSHITEDINLINILLYFYSLKYQNLQVYYGVLYKNNTSIRLISFVLNETSDKNESVIINSNYICLKDHSNSFDIFEKNEFIKKYKITNNNFQMRIITSTPNLRHLLGQSISFKQQIYFKNLETTIEHIIKKISEIYNIEAYNSSTGANQNDYNNSTYHNFVANRNNSERLLYNSHYKDMKYFIKSQTQNHNKYTSFDCIDCGNIIMMYISYLKSKYSLYNLEAAQVHISADYDADFLHSTSYGGTHRVVVITNHNNGKNKSFYKNLECLEKGKNTYVIDILNKKSQYYGNIKDICTWVPDSLTGSFASIQNAKNITIDVVSTLEEMLNYSIETNQNKQLPCTIF